MGQLLAPIENAIGAIMAFIYQYIPSVGLSIIIVTMLIMLLLFPLTHKQTKSTLAMQALQPKMKELQAKYKDDKAKLSEETMALYKEAGVNPVAGCLPLVIQMPFFLSIFRVVRNIQNYVKPNTELFKAMCAPAKTLKVCTGNAGTFVKAGFPPSQAENLANKLPASKQFFGLNLNKSLIASVRDGASVLTIMAYVVLMLLIVIVSYISISRSQSLNPNTPSQMKMLKYIMPFLVAISPIILPAGSNLYILTSASWRALQQEFLYRKIILPHHEKAKTKDTDDTKSIAESTDDADTGLPENYQPGLARQKRKKK